MPSEANDFYGALPLQQQDIINVLESYQTLDMICPVCGEENSVAVPVNLKHQNCDNCHHHIDPVGRREGKLVDHLLMQKMISNCYKHIGFAKKLLELYSRDYHHSNSEEFGIDKTLLSIHAINAIILEKHKSKLLLLAGFLALIPVIGTFVAAYITSRKLYKNIEYKENYLGVSAYNPCEILLGNLSEIEQTLEFIDYRQPQNLYFFSGYNPFSQFGNNDGSWSFLVDRRKDSSGEIQLEAIDLNVEATYQKLIDQVCQIKGGGISPFRFTVDNVVLVDGALVRVSEAEIFHHTEQGYFPNNAVTAEHAVELLNATSDTVRAYKRITYYDSNRSLCIRSFVRIQNQGPYTFIESVGAQLLSMTENLYEKYKMDDSSEELLKTITGPSWWQRIPIIKRKRIAFTGWLTLSSLVFSPIAAVVLLSKYRMKFKKEDIYSKQSTGVVFPFNLVAGLFGMNTANKEKARINQLKKLKFQQQANEIGFTKNTWSLRYGQSRLTARNYFESEDLSLIRRTQDLTIQEAFLESLEDAGIDSSDFRKGTAQINNYGIINSGKIEGDVKAEQKAPEKTKSPANKSVERELSHHENWQN